MTAFGLNPLAHELPYRYFECEMAIDTNEIGVPSVRSRPVWPIAIIGVYEAADAIIFMAIFAIATLPTTPNLGTTANDIADFDI